MMENDGKWGGKRDGAGRPTQERKKVQASLAVYKDDWEKIKALAKESGLSASEFIVKSILK